MQPLESHQGLQRQYSREILQFPVLPFKESIHDWLENSRLVCSSESSKMASHADDSSVDDNLSSVGESAWDMIDEGSAASDDDSSSLSRQATPYSDQLEHVHFGTESFVSNSTSNDGRGAIDKSDTTASRQMEINELIGKSEATTNPLLSGLGRNMNDRFPYQYFGSDQPEVLKFYEGTSTKLDKETYIDVSNMILYFEAEVEARLATHLDIGERCIVGNARQRMSQRGLILNDAFKLAYVGPNEMKSLITRKIGSALAVHVHSLSHKDALDSSRVTVVPVSAFADDASPEVVLIDSVGVDMEIEDCTAATSSRDLNRNTISLEFNHQKTVQSIWSNKQGSYVLLQEYKLPDLAVIYQPSNESSEGRQKRSLVKELLLRHDIPYFLISYDNECVDLSLDAVPNAAVPHISIDVMVHGVMQPKRRLPINLSTFLAIDASQMNRNLAYLTSISAELQKRPNKGKSKNDSWYQFRSINCLLTPLFAHGKTAIAISFLLAYITFFLTSNNMPNGIVGSKQNLSHSSTSLATTTVLETFTIPWTLSATPAIIRKPQDMLGYGRSSSTALGASLSHRARNMLDSSAIVDESEEFHVQVVGESHILLSPPGSIKTSRKASKLQFKVQRKQQNLTFKVSTLLNKGVYVLEIPLRDAYGRLDISVWTSGKPNVNETFQIDFGNPWLKLEDWRNSMQAIRENLLEGVKDAGDSLSTAFTDGVSTLTSILHNGTDSASLQSVLNRAKDAEVSFSANLKQAFCRESKKIENLERKLHRIATKLQKERAKAAIKLTRKSGRLRKALNRYYEQTAHSLLRQANIVTAAASGINVAELGRELQAYRATHFREAQKKMLHVWWSLSGRPPPKNPGPASSKRSQPTLGSQTDNSFLANLMGLRR